MIFLRTLFLSLLLVVLSGCPIAVEPDEDIEDITPTSPITWQTCSQAIGDHPCDFSLIDQSGNTFSLYDHYGDFIVIDLSVMWCGPCQRAAAEVQATEDFFNAELGSEQSFVYVTILIENLDREPPTVEDISDWATYFEITTSPVLQGSRDLLGPEEEGWPLQSWPTFFFIDDELVLQDSKRGWNQQTLDSMIMALLGIQPT